MDVFLKISHSAVWVCAKECLDGKVAIRRTLKDANLAIDIFTPFMWDYLVRFGGRARYGNRVLQTRLTFYCRYSNELLKNSALYEKNLRRMRSRKTLYRMFLARKSLELVVVTHLITMLSASSMRE